MSPGEQKMLEYGYASAFLNALLNAWPLCLYPSHVWNILAFTYGANATDPTHPD